MTDPAGVLLGALVTMAVVVLTPLAKVLASGLEGRMGQRSVRRQRAADLVVAWEDFGRYRFGFDEGTHRKYEKAYSDARARLVEVLTRRDAPFAESLSEMFREAKSASSAAVFKEIIAWGSARIETWSRGQSGRVESESPPWAKPTDRPTEDG